MGDRTGIEWTDATWNPVTGCTKVSPGCDHCYAETIAHRFDGTPAYPNGFGVTLRPERLDQPLRWTKPRRVFVNSMSDLFHDEIPDEYIARVWAVMACSPKHTFQILTKRHGRMRSLLGGDFREQVAEEITDLLAFRLSEWGVQIKGAPLSVTGTLGVDRIWGPAVWPLPNVWLGVSVENQQWADIRIPALLETPAAVRFLSCEPLLGPVDLAAHHPAYDDIPDEIALDWVIVGGESGRGARPMDPRWARSLRDQCFEAGVAYHFKQWGEWAPQYNLRHPNAIEAPGPRVWEEHLLSGAGGVRMCRVGKKAAGRELDGCTWDEFPAPDPPALR